MTADQQQVKMIEEEIKRRAYTLNTAKTVAVSTDAYWIPIDENTPRGVKLQLLGDGGVAIYSAYFGDPFWTHWCPLPKKQHD